MRCSHYSQRTIHRSPRSSRRPSERRRYYPLQGSRWHPIRPLIIHNNMAKLPEGKTRLDLVREGLAQDAGLKKRGRLVVGISKVKEDAKNERKTFRNMQGLIASIKEVGLIEPITVTAEPDETYRIIT